MDRNSGSSSPELDANEDEIDSSSRNNAYSTHRNTGELESSTTDSSPYRTYRSRWYILALFSAMCCLQCVVWNTFGPIERGVRYAYPNWNADTVAMQANWGTILFILGVGPICWILSKTNLRFASLLSCGLMTAGTVARIFTYHDEEIFLYTANACSILNGITGILVMAAPAALSAAWFPANERATATSISQVLNAAGNGFSYLLGPLIVPDNFLNKTAENDTSPEIPLTNLTVEPPTPNEEKVYIWYYMVGMAASSVIIFVAMVIYFPSRPRTPPTASASSEVPRIDFMDSVKTLFKDRSVMICFVGFSLSTGVQGGWAAVMTLNFQSLGVNDETSGYIGVAVCAASIVIGIAVGQFTDHIRKHIKVTLIFMLLFSTGAYVWLTLLILKVIPYSLIQLYASTICGSGCITAIMTLFFEYTVEMSYPVPEGIVGGLLTGGNNVMGCIFLSLFQIPEVSQASPAWMNYALVASTALVIPLIFFTKEKYVRLDLDDPSNNSSQLGDDEEDRTITYASNVPYRVME